MKTNEKTLLNRIERNPGIMLGKPVIKGTRLPIDILLEKLAYGASVQDLRSEYPFLKADDIRSVLLYASKMISLNEEVVF